MDWNDYLTIVFGLIATILTLIQIYQAIPKSVKLVFSEITIDKSIIVSKEGTFRAFFMIENISKKNTKFSITAKLKIESKGVVYCQETNKKINNRFIKLKEPIFAQLIFDFPYPIDTWDKPKIKFAYSFSKGDKITTKKTRWQGGIKE